MLTCIDVKFIFDSVRLGLAVTHKCRLENYSQGRNQLFDWL